MKLHLILLVACLLALAAPLCADDAEGAAVKVIEKLGGTATRDEDDPARPVVTVSFVGAPVTDRGLKELAPLKHLRTLDLAVCLGVTDAGLKDVAGLKGLEELNLSYTGTTDAGLKRLAGVKGLRKLNLIGDRVTDEGVAELQKALLDCKIDR